MSDSPRWSGWARCLIRIADRFHAHDESHASICIDYGSAEGWLPIDAEDG